MNLPLKWSRGTGEILAVLILSHWNSLIQCMQGQLIGSSFLLWGWWDTGTGHPKELWISHLWKQLRPGWIGLWANWSIGKFPAHGTGVWMRLFLRFFPTQTTLWFHQTLPTSTQKFTQFTKHGNIFPLDKEQNHSNPVGTSLQHWSNFFSCQIILQYFHSHCEQRHRSPGICNHRW